MAIQIFILSKLMEEDNYPYNLKKQISELQSLDSINGLTESKLYYHFESLAKQGLIETKEVIKEDNRPDKHVFAITEKGREALPKKIYKSLENANTIGDMVIGLANIKHVDRDRVIHILEKKLNAMHSKWDNLFNSDRQQFMKPRVEVLAEFVSDYANFRIQGSIQYLERLIEHVRKGEI
ncbi:PadR family transcriptional regulator [Lysinibacillus tabacifolii]|uniref:PadR family transcriptional regulator n=1 Tax=Lysinibacillus tabacifolii TaxID=1173107 RepID=A0ABY2T1D8_9BACI|nr:PadR family transcriptional regulator [Lysinibacillus tabacifolii]TKI48287.1 PadR family transcriptional regulator [Lysinibacillus tabacifolii]